VIDVHTDRLWPIGNDRSVSRIDCFVSVRHVEHLLETRKVVSQVLKEGSALPEDGVAREQGAVSGKNERDGINGVPGTLQNLEFPSASI